LGQVLKMNGAKRMYTVSGQEVRSFSQLRNEFADVDTFYLGVGSVGGGVGGVMLSPVRRARSRAPQTAIVEDISKQRRARSKSRPRALYAPESEIVRTNGKFLFNPTALEPLLQITLYWKFSKKNR
jgi:microtubule-associated protein-like 1/2